MTDPVGTLINEGQAFIDRHPDLSETGKSWGGMAWGLLRAYAECPDHPGAFCVPLDKQWSRMRCPADGTVWITGQ